MTASCRCTVSNSPRRCSGPKRVRAPIILRVESRAGHGGSTPVTKRIDEAADRWSFLVKNLQMDVPVDNE